MSDALLIDGVLHAPHFIFIRCGGELSDLELLDRFGLSGYERGAWPPGFRRHVLITNDEEWTHVCDDWFYSLWHMPSTRETIADIASEYDVFACSAGDSDQSWEFVYYRHGRLLRRYVVDDPNYRGGVVVEDLGIPLEGEEEAMKLTDGLTIALRLASTLGVDVRHADKEIRVYAKPGREAGLSI